MKRTIIALIVLVVIIAGAFLTTNNGATQKAKVTIQNTETFEEKEWGSYVSIFEDAARLAMDNPCKFKANCATVEVKFECFDCQKQIIEYKSETFNGLYECDCRIPKKVYVEVEFGN